MKEPQIFAVTLAVGAIILIGENSSYLVSIGVFLFAWANNLDKQ